MDALWADDPATLGPFRLLGRLGSGGMGVVYLGESEGGRRAAVKVVHADLTGDRAFRTRFAREIEVARHATGPWTAQVLDADPEAARPWLATEYVEGPSLEERVGRDGPLDSDAVVRLAARLGEALAALHAAGVVHRDLKPSNVLLAADGPRLIDFGIARALDVTKITHTGHVIGTPAFMSPEQASGEEVEAPSDVFSLASVLVFAATGSGPFGTTDNPVAMLFRVSGQEPATVGLPEPLRAHVAACLARDPAARPTAHELAERLRSAGAAPAPPPPATLALADSEPSAPPPPSPPRGNRMLVWLLAASAALAAALTVVLVSFAGSAPTAPQASTTAAPPPPPMVEIGQVGQVRLGSALKLAITPDGARILVSSPDGVRIVDTATRTASAPVPTGLGAISPDGARMYFFGRESSAVVDIAGARVVENRPALPGFPRDVVLSPDGRTGFITFFNRPEVAVMEMATGRVSATIPLPAVRGETVGTMSLSPDGTALYLYWLLGGPDITVEERKQVVVIDTTTRTVAATIPFEAWWAGFAPGGDTVVLANTTEFAAVDRRTHRQLRTGLLPSSTGPKIGIAPDGRHLAMGALDGTIRLVDTATPHEIATTKVPGFVQDLIFSPDGRTLYATVEGGVLVIMDTSTMVR